MEKLLDKSRSSEENKHVSLNLEYMDVEGDANDVYVEIMPMIGTLRKL